MRAKLPEAGIPLRKFPSKAVSIYLAVQVLTGLFVSLASLGDYQVMHSFFAPIDDSLPTFKTWFVQSKDPIGCKVMLLLWWLVFVPWGLIWFGRLTKGFRPFNWQQAFPNAWSRIKFLTIGLFFSALFAYGHSFMDQTSNFASSSLKSGISSFVPFVIKAGPAYFAYYLAATSFVAVIAISLVLVLVLEIFFPSKSL